MYFLVNILIGLILPTIVEAQIASEVPKSIFQPDEASSIFLAHLYSQATRDLSNDQESITKGLTAVCIIDAINSGSFSLAASMSESDIHVRDKCKTWALKNLKSKHNVKTPYTVGLYNTKVIFATMNFYLDYMTQVFPEAPQDIKLSAVNCMTDWVRKFGKINEGFDLIVHKKDFGVCANFSGLSSWVTKQQAKKPFQNLDVKLDKADRIQ
jgi:hypothetical protein